MDSFDQGTALGVTMGALVSGLITALVTTTVMSDHCRYMNHREAVEHHAGHWEVKTDGSTVFHWNDEVQGEKK